MSDDLTPTERARYRDGMWMSGTKLPPVKPRPRGDHNAHPTMVDAAPFGVVVRELVARGFTQHELAVLADVGDHTVRELVHGKRSLQVRTAEKLRRLATLLPKEDA